MGDGSIDGVGLRPEFQSALKMSVEAQRRPIERLEGQKALLEEKVNLLSDVIGRVDAVKEILPNLSNPIQFRELTVKSTDEKVLTGTADKTIASPGSHSFEILRLASPAQALSNAYPDKDETRIGTGYFQFETADGETREVFIDNENATLEGVARSINQANIGVRAAVVNDVSDEELSYRLVLSHDGTGSKNSVVYPNYYFVDPDEELYFDQENPAKNAMIRYQGFEMEVDSNKVEDLIPGVTLNIRGLSDPGKPETISVANDIPQTSVKVKDLVDRLNGVLSFIQDQNKIDENTKTAKTLGNDYGIRLAQNKIHSALGQTFIGDSDRAIHSLVELGIRFKKDGLLEFDEEKFNKFLDSDYSSVMNFLSGDGFSVGIFPRLSQALDEISTGRFGVLSNQKTNYAGQMRKLDQQIETKTEAATQKAKFLKEKLMSAQNALDSVKSQSGVFAGMGGGDLTSLIGK